MFYTSSVGFHGEKQGAKGLVDFRAWLVSPPSDAERAALGIRFEHFNFERVKEPFLGKMTLQSLFPVGGLFSHNAPVSAVHYKGGSFLTALSKKHRQATATRLLKSNESHTDNKSTRLSDLYATPKAREETRARAVGQAAKRHGVAADSVLVTGEKTRTPVSAKRGFVRDVRFFHNLDELRHTGAFVKEPVRNAEAVPPVAAAAAASADVLFTIHLQSLGLADAEQAKLLLSWLKLHPVVALDPGLRWIVSGIVARLTAHEVGADGSVKLFFAYRNVRISGRKWSHFAESAAADSFLEHKLESTIKGAVDRLSESDFLCAEDKTKFVADMFNNDAFTTQVEASFEKLLAKRTILRKEQRFAHQKRLSLEFVRKIDLLCVGFGDPVVVVGSASGNGGRGRAQVNHKMLLETLAGFFCVLLLDEYCTSKKTPCCHRDAYAAKCGRSRGCKHCCAQNRGKPTVWWDRDSGASW